MRPSWPPPSTPRVDAWQERLVWALMRRPGGKVMLRAASVCSARKASSCWRSAGSSLASRATANSAALAAPAAANGKRGHGNALGHLHNAVQRIHTLQVAAGHGHAQHGHGGLGGDHAGQVGRTARTGDDGLQAPAGGGFGVGEHVVGHAVGRDHPRLVRDAELLKNLHCVLHGVPVAAGTHDHADLDGFHGVWGWRCGCAEQPLAMDGTRDFTFCAPHGTSGRRLGPK